MFFTTAFPATENPISQGGGIWTRGASEGLDWTDPQTGPNSAATGNISFGTQPAIPGPPDDDSIAHLSGFGTDHYAEGVIFNQATDQIEVELFLRMKITAHNARGYEIDYVFSGVGSCNVSIVRWEGALNTFTVLNGGNPIIIGLDISDGTTHRASIKGNLITLTRNGVVVATYDLLANFVADGSKIWQDGNPGFGHWDRSLSNGANRNTMGWSSFTADDGLTNASPFVPIRRSGPRRLRLLPQRFPDVTPSAITFSSTIGAWNWNGRNSPLSIQIHAAIGSWTWLGKTSSLSTQIKATVGAWSWSGKTSSLSTQINATIGNWTWAGTHASIGNVTTINATIGAWTWKGDTSSLTIQIHATIGTWNWVGVKASLSTMIGATKGQWTWLGTHATVTTSGAGSTVVFYDGLNMAGGLNYHKDIRRPHIELTPAGGNTFTVSKTIDVAEERQGILKETILIDGDIP
jgi:hypothetical protein